MKLNYLLYYIIYLVNEGHRWQYQNLNGSGTPSPAWFSPLQLIAIIVAVTFLFVQPDGLLHENIIDNGISTRNTVAFAETGDEKFNRNSGQSISQITKKDYYCIFSQLLFFVHIFYSLSYKLNNK